MLPGSPGARLPYSQHRPVKLKFLSIDYESPPLPPPLPRSPPDIPGEVRLQALQAVVLLMPDENREALQTLLYFLSEVAAYSEANQVTTHH